ncbi:hypothetical protein GCM10023114_56830 [Mycolicibacterium sediminis]|uniref:Uncharacterized protein n=1 Tax=Mycolicibacterium sediminis TaxID=1286180 RepID=A0A7I7QNV8_9MYCO|nr:hypothetical protein MSEDJ_20970 [Mycolicibacterium sediminis]
MTRKSLPNSDFAAVAHQDHDLRRDGLEFGEQPRPAGHHLEPARRLVQPSAAALRAGELEVLDGVGDVQRLPGDARSVECLVQHPSRRSDERGAGPVLVITGLFAHQHHPRGGGTVAEHDLVGVLI